MRDERFPRPLLRRAAWESLDGSWEFAVDLDSEWEHPSAVDFDAQILVPFCPETVLSGVNFRGDLNRCWYRRTWHVPDEFSLDQRAIFTLERSIGRHGCGSTVKWSVPMMGGILHLPST